MEISLLHQHISDELSGGVELRKTPQNGQEAALRRLIG
jgi:hypothetical protein